MSALLEAVARRLADQFADRGITLSVRATKNMRDDWELLAVRAATKRLEVDRFASAVLDGRTLLTIERRGEPGALIDYIMHHARELVRALTPPAPIPVFRIGTRPHPKRLVARAA